MSTTHHASHATHFRSGLLTGFIANLLIFFWIWKTFNAAHIGFLTTLNVWILLALVLGAYVGLFAWFHAKLPANWARPWLAGGTWVALDQIKSVALTGFPWALLGHTQAYNLPFIQLASWAGVGGLTFFIVLFNAALGNGREAPKNFSVVCLTLALIFGWGAFRLRKEKVNSPEKNFRVAILQANIDQYQKWDSAYEAGIRQRYEELVKKAAQTKPDLIVWPESAVPGWFPNQKFYFDWVRGLVIRSQTYHLIGAVTSHRNKDFNAVFLIDPLGHIVAEYDKQHLVPFGEYIPFGGFLKRWIPYLGQLGTFAAGEKPILFQVNNTIVTPNICYEAIFPGLIRKSVKQGADVIVNITNDGWFLDTGAPEQHYVANIFRAVENHRPVIRTANTGICAVIDANGREILRSHLLTRDAFVVEVPVPGH